MTILAFPQSSLVQSLALSHREYSPMSMFDGVKVSVEYIENQGSQWPSEHSVRERNGRQICEQEHRNHRHCYRAGRNLKNWGKITNGAMPR